MSIACYQAGMYHPNSTRREHGLDSDFEITCEGSGAAMKLVENHSGYHSSDKSDVATAMALQCECGNEFLSDTIHCRRCGVRRPEAVESH